MPGGIHCTTHVDREYKDTVYNMNVLVFNKDGGARYA